jgi:small subunit ribosomal protein S1
VNLTGDVNGLLHTTEINSEESTAENSIKLEVGDKVQAKIIEINPEEHRIALSIKALDDGKEKAEKPAKKKAASKKEDDEQDEPKKEKAEKTEKAVKKTTKKAAKKKEE